MTAIANISHTDTAKESKPIGGRPKGSRPRNKIQRENDKHLIKDFYLKGYNIRGIVEEINRLPGRPYRLCKSVVHSDIQEIQADLEANLSLEVKGHIARELAAIDKMEEVLWRAWEKSQQKLTKTTTATIGKKNPNNPNGAADIFHVNKSSSIEERDGNRGFLAEIRKLRDQRRQIIGLDQPKRQVLVDKDSGNTMEFVVKLSESEVP